MTQAMRIVTIFMLGSSLVAGRAFAQAPSAIVEAVSGFSTGVSLMDYVMPGKIIRLGKKGSLILGYLRSCWRESIVGGTVTVGQEQSQVKGGKVTRTKEKCDGGQMQLTAEQANKSGGVVARAPPTENLTKEMPSVTVYGVSPVFDVQRPGKLKIKRLDQPGTEIAIELTSAQLTSGAFFDSATTNAPLIRGGLYRADHDGRRVIFQVDAFAADGATPVIGRLVRFQPSK